MTDPGSVDNRLSINPSDFPEIQDWEDGQEYDIMIGGTTTTIRQLSPGEFEVVPPIEAAPATEEVAEVPAPARPRASNPAVSGMINDNYA